MVSRDKFFQFWQGRQFWRVEARFFRFLKLLFLLGHLLFDLIVTRDSIEQLQKELVDFDLVPLQPPLNQSLVVDEDLRQQQIAQQEDSDQQVRPEVEHRVALVFEVGH